MLLNHQHPMTPHPPIVAIGLLYTLGLNSNLCMNRPIYVEFRKLYIGDSFNHYIYNKTYKKLTKVIK